MVEHVKQAFEPAEMSRPHTVEMCKMAVMNVTRSALSYDETARSLVAAIEQRGLTVFARIDHAAGAREVGMQLNDEQVVLFGNARSGTPLMQDDPRIGIELPLRMLIWREGEQVLLGHNDPRELAGAYGVSAHAQTLEQMAALLDALAAEAADAAGSADATR
jgi:uncharacterized protein (DUF302 family)